MQSSVVRLAERRRVVLLCGGRSGEHGISCVTAAGVLRAIDRDRFEVIPVGITRHGATVLLDEQDLAAFALSDDAGSLPEVRSNGTRVLWPVSTQTRELQVLFTDEGRSEVAALRSLGRIDVVLPMLHGPYGEDGTVQGLLELLQLPYVGSGVLASALCMDKHAVKTVLAAAGVRVAPWRTLSRSEVQRDSAALARATEGVNYPLFVKPCRAGSSLGVSRVTGPEELPAALETAFAVDSMVLIEAEVVGRELEIAVLEGRAQQPPRVSRVCGEIVFTGRKFYDFEAKYLGGDGVELAVPAQISEREYAAIRDAAVRAFEVTGCAGLARIDVFLCDDGPVVNEINTLPGFTPISMYPRLWQESGLGYPQLITELIELALCKA